jgi:hypothetical protein
MGGAGYGSGAEGETGILLNKTTMTVPTQQPGDLVNQPDDITFTVDAADGSVSYTIAKNEAWLSLDSAAGTVTAGSPDTITVSFDTTDLAADTYTDTITVSSAGLEDKTIEVSMSLVNQNAYIEMDIVGDATTWPDATSIYAKDYIDPVPWCSADGKVWYASNDGLISVGQHAVIVQPNVAAVTGGGFWNTEAGAYNPNHGGLGNITNTVDMSLRYDGMRGNFWYYYNESYPSDGVYIYLASRPTAGTSSFGYIGITCSRSGIGGLDSNDLGVTADDGDGNTQQGDTNFDCDAKYLNVQFEFVKGSHFKFDFTSPASVGSFAPIPFPVDTGATYYQYIDLSGGNYANLVPMSPIFYCQSSQKNISVSRFSGMYLEYRKIGGTWETLVDAT